MDHATKSETEAEGCRIIIGRDGLEGGTPSAVGIRVPRERLGRELEVHHESLEVDPRRPVHGLAKTSAGRSGIPSLAFHMAACSDLPQSSYSRTTRSAASRSRDRSSTAIFAWRSFIPS